jgi:hypothetical protein
VGTSRLVARGQSRSCLCGSDLDPRGKIHQELIDAGDLVCRQCCGDGEAALTSEEAKVCLVLPLQQAVVHFACRNMTFTETDVSGSDDGEAHTSIGMTTWTLTIFTDMHVPARSQNKTRRAA